MKGLEALNNYMAEHEAKSQADGKLSAEEMLEAIYNFLIVDNEEDEEEEEKEDEKDNDSEDGEERKDD